MKFNSIEQLITLTTPDDIKNAGFKLDENYMIALTPDNAAKALECIKGNKRYEKSSYEVYYNKLGKSLRDYSKEELKNILWCVARSNSTRSSNENISVIADWVFKNLTQFLKRLEKGDTTLIEELATIKELSRKEKSLSSKICTYLCELEFKQSKFAVNDTVVRRILPYYLNYYGISTENKALENYSYSEIIALIDKIAVNLPPKMNYTEIDQIIWYCYRNDPVRSQIAVALT
ncbi:MAG TPA: hypothetical protein DEQ65_03240 [Ruminococcaceae bacterium]|nr:hypothetical protein [Oscillospiraceae bacterium]